MPDLTIAQRVESGAAWLDEHKPGWWQTIDVDRYEKLHARNATHAVHIAWQRGLLGPSTTTSTAVGPG